MQDLLNILFRDPTVKVAVTRFQKLKTHINYYANSGYKKLSGRRGSNCVYVMAHYVLPALLTYQNVKQNTGDLFGGASATKRLFLGRKKNPTVNIASNFIALCKEIERFIPELQFNVDSSGFSLTDRGGRQLSEVIKEKAQMAIGKKSSNSGYFWVVASCYYKELPEFGTPMMPNTDNPLQLTPYSIPELIRLEIILKDKLNNFCERNKSINSVVQQTEGKPTSRDLENPFEKTLFYTTQSPSYTCIGFAEKAHYPNDALDEMARDLFAYSMQIESWETLLYRNQDSRCLEYIPYDIACCYTVIVTYGTIFQMLRLDESAEDFFSESLAINFKLYLSNIHPFLRSVYNHDGSITETGEYILAGFRGFKRNSIARLVTPRGVNVWQDGAIGNNRRPGKNYY